MRLTTRKGTPMIASKSSPLDVLVISTLGKEVIDDLLVSIHYIQQTYY